MIKKTLLALPPILMLALSAICVISAAEQSPNDPCADAMTTARMRECQNQRYQQADKALNHVYKELMSQLDEARRAKLREAQRAWLAFRDKQAAFAASEAEGGTLYPLLYTAELTAMTERRIAELKAHLP